MKYQALCLLPVHPKKHAAENGPPAPIHEPSYVGATKMVAPKDEEGRLRRYGVVGRQVAPLRVWKQHPKNCKQSEPPND